VPKFNDKKAELLQGNHAISQVFWGLNFANIIHYRPKVTMVSIGGLTCKDSKVLTRDSWKLPLSTAPLSFDAPS